MGVRFRSNNDNAIIRFSEPAHQEKREAITRVVATGKDLSFVAMKN